MILVTGGAGFIGSNLVAGIAAAGLGPVAICDRLGQDERWRNIAKRQLDAIVPPEELESWLAAYRGDVSAIFHMGAISATTATDADAVVATNITLSQHLWDVCVAQEMPFIYASSASVYGDGQNGFDDDNTVDAMAALKPLNLYGWSKLQFDRWVADQVARQAGEPPLWAGLRFFNVYGPNERHKGPQSSVVPHFYDQICDTGVARLFKSCRDDVADGEQARDFVFVDDCVDVMLWLYGQRATDTNASGIYNLGTGTARTFLDLAHGLFAAVDKKPQIEFFDMPQSLRDHYQYFTQADMDRLRSAGYNGPSTNLEDGVATYVNSYLAAADQYR